MKQKQEKTRDLQTMQRELRRHQDTMIVLGIGVILFGIWDIIKSILYLVLDPYNENKQYYDDVVQDVGNASYTEVFIGTMIITVIFLIIEILLRLRIARNAIREAQGEEKVKRYFGLLCFMTLVPAASVVLTLRFGFIGDSRIFDSVITIIVEMTSLFVMINLIISCARSRRLRRRIAQALQEERTQVG